MTNKQQFQEYLKDHGFKTSGVFNHFPLNPVYYKSPNKDHFIASGIHVCVFGGSDTPKGDLGCVTFAYHGTYKRKGCRTVSSTEVFKKAFVPKNATEAIEQLQQWLQKSKTTLQKEWKRIL